MVESTVTMAEKYFTRGRTVVISLPDDETYNGTTRVLTTAVDAVEDPIFVACRLMDRVHKMAYWPLVVSRPGGEIKKQKRGPTDWDTTNNDFHGSYVLVAAEEPLRSLAVQMRKLESYAAWNSRAKFVVIVLGDVEGGAKSVLEVLWRWQIMNVVVLLQKSRDEVGVHTWFPYRAPSGSCGKLLDAVLLDVWADGGFLRDSFLYPDKVPDDMEGCPIRASTFEFHPFIICDPKLGVPTNTSIVDGLEIRLMYCIARGMNMNLVLRIPPGDDRGGIQLPNGTWTGLRADIVYGLADITFASLLSKLEDHLIFDDTVNYFTDRFTWFVARAKPYPRWLSMARVFSPLTWLVGLLVLLSAALFMRLLFCLEIIKTHEVSRIYWRYSICLSSVWASFLGEGVPTMPRSLPLRLFFLSMIMYSLAVNNVFQAFFTSYVVNPGLLHQIGNVEELVSSDLVFAFYYVLDKFFTADFLQKLKPRLQCEPFTCLDYVATKDNYATFCGRALLAYIIDELVKQEGKHEIYPFREDSFQLNSVMLLPKGSHLLDRVNEVMTHIVEAGLPNQFLKSILDQRGIEAGVLALEDLSDEYEPLTMNHLQGSFFFLLIGFAMAFAMLIFELMKKLKK
ncbi:ionotropic receptor 21a-like [Periplaneta americana]|uniref:ionotropic receptor 21a-like n=1 Tax=Periplaneta americana TaxID=6978 RepID=UPI0037E92A16